MGLSSYLPKGLKMSEFRQDREWVKEEYFKVFDRETGEEVGEVSFGVNSWEDSVDRASRKTDAACVWASDNGLGVDDLWWD